MALIHAGLAARANALPAVVSLATVLPVVHHRVIKREETYLERKFGDGIVHH